MRPRSVCLGGGRFRRVTRRTLVRCVPRDVGDARWRYRRRSHPASQRRRRRRRRRAGDGGAGGGGGSGGEAAARVGRGGARQAPGAPPNNPYTRRVAVERRSQAAGAAGCAQEALAAPGWYVLGAPLLRDASRHARARPRRAAPVAVRSGQRMQNGLRCVMLSPPQQPSACRVPAPAALWRPVLAPARAH